MNYVASLTGILALFFLSVWLWAPLALMFKTRRYNNRNPKRKTPRRWTMMDYIGLCGTLSFFGTVLLLVAGVLRGVAS